jgi:hypothetical protein
VALTLSPPLVWLPVPVPVCCCPHTERKRAAAEGGSAVKGAEAKEGRLTGKQWFMQQLAAGEGWGVGWGGGLRVLRVGMRPEVQPKSHECIRGGRMASQGQGSQDMWQ